MYSSDGMITQLPEALMILIISFLPLIDAVRLCSLSKRWLHLWVFSRILEFDENRFIQSSLNIQFQYGMDVGMVLKMKKRERKRFIEYINTTMSRLEQPELLKFSLHMSKDPDYFKYIEEWINLVLTKSVKELALNFSDEILVFYPSSNYVQYFELPEVLLESKSLQVLTLNFCMLRRSTMYRFTALRSLSLTRTCFTMDLVCNLETSFPNLEFLSLVNCHIMDNLHISSHSRLERLIIRGCMPLINGIEISASRLRYFDYLGQMVTFKIGGELEELVEVVLDFELQFHFLRCSVELCDLLRGFKHAMGLTVCPYLLKVFSLLYELPTPLLNLKSLTMRMSLEGCVSEGMMCLLRSSPNLESLSIQIVFNSLIDDLVCSHIPEKTEKFCAPSGCLVSHLKTIKIVGFTGRSHEMDLLTILLKNAGGLETVIILPQPELPLSTEIISSEASSTISSAAKKLEVLERASPRVQIIFHSMFTMQPSLPMNNVHHMHPLYQKLFSDSE